MTTDSWIEHYKSDILSNYLVVGGSVFKVISLQDASRMSLETLLHSVNDGQTLSRFVTVHPPEGSGYSYRTPSHFDGLYSAAMADVSFSRLVAKFISNTASDLLKKDVSPPLGSKSEFLDQCELEEGSLFNDLVRPIKSTIRSYPSIGRSFANAVALEVDILTSFETKVDDRLSNKDLEEVLQRWFVGARPISGDKVCLRKYGIHTWLDRNNARSMLASALSFSLLIGLPPLTVIYSRWDDLTLHVNKTVWLNLLHTFRDLIDDVEHMPGLAVLFVVDPQSIDGNTSRKLKEYEAFYLRVYNDLSIGDNPDAVMVGLE
jgi:hypothetical protein